MLSGSDGIAGAISLYIGAGQKPGMRSGVVGNCEHISYARRSSCNAIEEFDSCEDGVANREVTKPLVRVPGRHAGEDGAVLSWCGI